MIGNPSLFRYITLSLQSASKANDYVSREECEVTIERKTAFIGRPRLVLVEPLTVNLLRFYFIFLRKKHSSRRGRPSFS